MSKLFEQLDDLRRKTLNIPAASPDFNLEKQVKAMALALEKISSKVQSMESLIESVHGKLDAHTDLLQRVPEPVQVPAAPAIPFSVPDAVPEHRPVSGTRFSQIHEAAGPDPQPEFIPSISTENMELKGSRAKTRVIKGKKSKDLVSGMEVLDGPEPEKVSENVPA